MANFTVTPTETTFFVQVGENTAAAALSAAQAATSAAAASANGAAQTALATTQANNAAASATEAAATALLIESGLRVQAYDLAAESQVNIFVNAQSGNNSNAGTSRGASLASLAQGRTNATTGQTIGLFRGQRYIRDGATALDENLYGYGQAGSPPQLDVRASLAGATWTSDGDGAWYTDITLAESTIAGGVGSNTTEFGVWFNDQFGVWKVGGADIAANIAAVKARPAGELAFAINRVGSTVQDIRSDTASTGPFRLYVKMPDGSNPTGKAVLYTNRQAVALVDSRTLTGVECIGSFGKDFLGVSNYNNIATLIDCTARDFGEHGSVVPANFTRHSAIGAVRPGKIANLDSARGRATGAAINLFTPVFQPDRVLTINGATLSNAAQGIYFHGSGNQGYRRLDITGLPVVMRNVRNAFRGDPVGAGQLPVFTDGILCSAYIDVEGIDNGFQCEGNWQFLGGGRVVITSNPIANGCNLVDMRGAQSYVLLKDFDITCETANSLSFFNILCARTSGAGNPAPTLILDGVRDLSAVANRLLWARASSPATIEQTNLVLRGATQLWDLTNQANRINFPASLTVEAGCRFGWGDRTGPQIEAALTAAGVPFTISGQTTIVGLTGTTLSAPGWK